MSASGSRAARNLFGRSFVASISIAASVAIPSSLAVASCGVASAVSATESTRASSAPFISSAADRTYTMLACGDVLLARTPGKRSAEFGYQYLFKGVKDLVSSADVAFANLEMPASYVGAPYPGKPENVTFRADPETLFGIAWAGFDAVSLANNHINDYGPRAISETLDFIDLLGIARSGAGRNLEEARQPAIVERDGVRFAFLAYAEPIWSVVVAKNAATGKAYTRAEKRLYGTTPYESRASDSDSAKASSAGVAGAIPGDIVSDIRRVKNELQPDYLFVSIHWGDEHQHIPNDFQRTLGKAAIDAGATAVLGHHPHVLQSIERYGDGLIIYSLGNFVFDMAADHTYETAAIAFILSSGRICRVDVIPLRIERGVYAPSRALPVDAKARLQDIVSWSTRFHTKIVIEDGIGRIFF